jgi:NTE family protein
MLIRHTFYAVLFALLFCMGCAHTPAPDFVLLPDERPPAKKLKNVRVALVLGGGGARAVAHAGVIEVLEANHIPFDLIVGSSAGSVIAVLYADKPCAKTLKQKIIALKKDDLLDISWYSGAKMLWGKMAGPIEGNALRRFMQDNMQSTDFSQLKIPVAVVTTDIDSGKTFVLRSGPIVPAIHASSAIPMVFTPVRLYGKTLVDGGVASPVPVEVAKTFSPKVIIAVDIGTSPDYGPVNNLYQLGVRSLHISYFNLAQSQTRMADVVIHPAVDDYGMFEDSANEVLYEAGRQAALKALPQIRRALRSSNDSPFIVDKRY